MNKDKFRAKKRKKGWSEERIEEHLAKNDAALARHRAKKPETKWTAQTHCRFCGKRLKAVANTGGWKRHTVCRGCGRDNAAETIGD